MKSPVLVGLPWLSPVAVAGADTHEAAQSVLDQLLCLSAKPGGLSWDELIGRLDQWCASLLSARAPGERKLRRVLHHGLYLLRDGTVLSTMQQSISLAGTAALQLEAVTLGPQGLRKVSVQIAQGIVADHGQVFDAYLGAPSVLCRVKALTIETPCPAGEPTPTWPSCLDADDYGAFFGNQQAIAEAIRDGREGAGKPHRAFMRRQALQVRADVRRWHAILAGECTGLLQEAAGTHPYFRPVLHILPRLLGTADGSTALRTIADQCEQIAAMGFGAVLLGVVDPQTVDVYYGETEDGRLAPTRNDHGYWSTGQCGIDVRLGSAADYRALAARVRATGLELIQDAVFATLGYPAQLPRFAASSLANPCSSVVLGQHEVKVSDPVLFLHDGAWVDSEDVAAGVGRAEGIVQAQLSTFFALPRPNLFLPDVFASVLERSRWQASEAGVGAFRIDMAKHLPAAQLKAIVHALRAAPRDAATPFMVLLEYLSTDYVELAYALAALEDQRGSAYLYDFPLAAALHRIFAGAAPMAAEVNALLAQRRQAKMPLRAMVPTYIDHDGQFTPLFDGTAATQAAVVTGYALAMLLSANGPAIYMGFAHAQAGAAPHVRCRMASLFGDDPVSPAPHLARLFAAFAQSGLIEHWDGSAIVCEADGEDMWLRRAYQEPGSGRRRCVEALFSRSHLPAPEPAPAALFHFAGAPSVMIRIRELPAPVSPSLPVN